MLAGRDRTVGENLPCTSALYRCKRPQAGFSNMLAGGFASDRRE